MANNSSHIVVFVEVIMIASWAIWIHHNNFIFNNVQISFGRWKMEF
jgi:hypothetical protein